MPTATAIITLIDATSTSDAGNIIGEQRIDGTGDGPIAFAVPFDADAIDPTHAYALFATVVDGTSSWQNATGVPVITGGPVEAVTVPTSPVVAGSSTTLTGPLPLPNGDAAAAPAVADRRARQAGHRHARQPPGPPDPQGSTRRPSRSRSTCP